MEYYAYKPDVGWRIKEVAKVLTVTLIIAILFYDNLLAMPALLPVGIYLWRMDCKNYKRQAQGRLRQEFKEFIILLSGALNAGYSLEQGIKNAYQDMMAEEGFFYIPKELATLLNGLRLNKDVEALLMDMGKRCQEDTIIEFAKLVATAKKYGGNINTIINKTRKKLNDRVMVEREIDTMVAAKRLEGYIMLLMPFGIVLYMRLTNGNYISSLYESGMGRLVVTFALVAVMACGLIIRKITEIEV